MRCRLQRTVRSISFFQLICSWWVAVPSAAGLAEFWVARSQVQQQSIEVRADNPGEVGTGPEDSPGFHTRVACFEEAVDSSEVAAGHSSEVAADHSFEVASDHSFEVAAAH